MYAHQLIDFLTTCEVKNKELLDAKEELAILEAQSHAIEKFKRKVAPKKPNAQQFDKICLEVERSFLDSVERKNLYNSHKSQNFYDKYCPDRRIVIDILKNSQHFYLGECLDFESAISNSLMNQSVLFENIYSNNGLRLPYQDICLHFSQEKEEDVDGTKKMVFLFRVQSKNSLLSYVADQKKLPDGSMFWAINKREMCFFEKKGSVYVVEKEVDDVEKTLCPGTENLLEIFMMLLDTKNIHVLENHPPLKLNKKRIKKGKSPLYKYHTLLVKVPGNYQKRKWGNKGNNLVGLHLCRGHFKTYTKENPLLGKHVGRYWWQPQARGNKKQGVIMKDYSVEIKEAALS
jgi:hypothetical protein